MFTHHEHLLSRMSVPIFPICHSGVPEKSREIVLDLEVLAEGDNDGFGEGVGLEH